MGRITHGIPKYRCEPQSRWGADLYLAHQIYQHSARHERTESDVTIFRDNRKLSRLVHGEQSGPWQDQIHSFLPDDQFEYSAYIGIRDDKASIVPRRDRDLQAV